MAEVKKRLGRALAREVAIQDSTIAWLMEGDPAIRWQVMRDLAGASERAVERERAKVSRIGWGARLLAKQDRNGRWAKGKSRDSGLYSPKWISTTYTMLLLRDLGLEQGNPHGRKACGILLDEGMQPDGGINYGEWARWIKRSETCITGMILSLLAYFRYEDARLEAITAHLLKEQMSDGGWNCRKYHGATHSSMHTTISALEGLWWRERGVRGNRRADLQAAQERGREFLLAHRLFRSHRTGAVIKPAFLKPAFPPRWHFDILRGLDHFRMSGANKDPRMEEAIEVLRGKRGVEGRWKLEQVYRGKTYFEMEWLGKESRWNTLRAMRVLRWWDGEKGDSMPDERARGAN